MATTKTGKSKKKDRNRKWCQAYRLRGQREINKAKKFARHIRKQPSDFKAIITLKELSATHRRRAGVSLEDLGVV